MDGDPSLREQIKEKLTGKATIQQKVYDNTFAVFGELKETLHEMMSELDDELEEKIDKRIKIEYRDRGTYEAQVQVAGDLLIFSMHTNVFGFSHDHPIWNNDYAKKDPANTYCGMINIYNFLADSLKFNRNVDEGYLVGRIFINREMEYFVEGKNQTGLKYDGFGGGRINREALVNIVECAINYALEFDLFAPPYDLVKVAPVDQFNTKLEHSKTQTGKRLGYKFSSEDI